MFRCYIVDWAEPDDHLYTIDTPCIYSNVMNFSPLHNGQISLPMGSKVCSKYPPPKGENTQSMVVNSTFTITFGTDDPPTHF